MRWGDFTATLDLVGLLRPSPPEPRFGRKRGEKRPIVPGGLAL